MKVTLEYLLRNNESLTVELKGPPELVEAAQVAVRKAMASGEFRELIAREQ